MYFSLRLCWDSKQSNNLSQYSGSVAYLFLLTVATVLEGGAVCISDRSRLPAYNLTTREDKLFVLASVFIATVPLGKGVCVREVYSFVARVLS